VVLKETRGLEAAGENCLGEWQDAAPAISVRFPVSQSGGATREKSRHGFPTAITSARSVVKCRPGTSKSCAKLNLSSPLAERHDPRPDTRLLNSLGLQEGWGIGLGS
jgi:hypothetical protein